MANKKQTQLQVQQDLENEIEQLELHEMSQNDIERVISGFSVEATQLRRDRKKVRYQLYRLKNEAEGRTFSESTDEFKSIYESQSLFDSWRFFGVTWDVSMDDPQRIVHKDKSEVEEWEELLKAKVPILHPGGRIEYPDVNVRRKIEAHIASKKK